MPRRDWILTLLVAGLLYAYPAKASETSPLFCSSYEAEYRPHSSKESKHSFRLTITRILNGPSGTPDAYFNIFLYDKENKLLSKTKLEHTRSSSSFVISCRTGIPGTHGRFALRFDALGLVKGFSWQAMPSTKKSAHATMYHNTATTFVYNEIYANHIAYFTK